ncbi:MAG: hypothetical protein ACOCYW_08625 [Roseicyclus sp.]
MDPHPDFAGTHLPREADLEGFRLTRLDPSVLDEDYAALMETGRGLAGLWGDWPSGLTREENAVDLAWHDREFTLRRSFAWVVRDPGGRYLGCLYLFPEPGGRGAAEVVTWIREAPDRAALLARVLAAVSAWIGPRLPAGIDLRWRTSPQLEMAEGAARSVGGAPSLRL